MHTEAGKDAHRGMQACKDTLRGRQGQTSEHAGADKGAYRDIYIYTREHMHAETDMDSPDGTQGQKWCQTRV